jgi:hypothetical protein
MIVAEYCIPQILHLTSNIMFVTDTIDRAKQIINEGGYATDWYNDGTYWRSNVKFQSAYYRLRIVEYKK